MVVRVYIGGRVEEIDLEEEMGVSVPPPTFEMPERPTSTFALAASAWSSTST